MPLLLSLAAAIAVQASTPADSCTAAVPPKLATQVTHEYPDYALPQLKDAGATRVRDIAETGDWPCPFVAIADFDGDGHWDRAVLLKHKTLPAVQLLAARNVNGAWQIEIQEVLPIPIGLASLEPLVAGLYEQLKNPVKTGVSPAIQLDSLVTIQADHAGFVVGQIEGTQVAYFFQNEVWQHIGIAE